MYDLLVQFRTKLLDEIVFALWTRIVIRKQGLEFDIARVAEKIGLAFH
jgi:hypothetical protein